MHEYDLDRGLDQVWEQLADTARTPGLVKLFVDMTAAASDPEHPAHEFMTRRSASLLGRIEHALGPGSEWQARVLQAAAEGLQVQWLRDPATDIAADMQRLAEVLLDTTQTPAARPAPRGGNSPVGERI